MREIFNDVFGVVDALYQIFAVPFLDKRPLNFEREMNKMKAAYRKRPYTKDDLPRPEWMDHDRLSRLYMEKDRVFGSGDIYYAYIVQANSILYKFFPQTDHSAQIVYSTDEKVNQNPLILEQMAKDLYRYKEYPIEQVPQDIRGIVEAIQNEHDRTTFHGKYYLVDGREIEVFFSTIMIFRKFLPYRQLIGGILPVIALPGKLDTALILPKKYWTKRFIKKYWN